MPPKTTSSSPDVWPPQFRQAPDSTGWELSAPSSAGLGSHQTSGEAPSPRVSSRVAETGNATDDDGTSSCIVETGSANNDEGASENQNDSNSSFSEAFDFESFWNGHRGFFSDGFDSDDLQGDDRQPPLPAPAPFHFDEDLLSRVPLDENGQLTSVGSIAHAEGRCYPCIFVRSAVGCVNGVACHCCHFPHQSSGGRHRRPRGGGAGEDVSREFEVNPHASVTRNQQGIELNPRAPVEHGLREFDANPDVAGAHASDRSASAFNSQALGGAARTSQSGGASASSTESAFSARQSPTRISL